MKLLHSTFAAWLAVALLAACNKGGEEPLQPGVPAAPLPEETWMNVSYGDDPQQVYDLYLPEGRTAAKTKVVVLVHGGGWLQGDKADMAVVWDHFRLAHPGHAIANINYVLADSGNTKAFPNQIMDLAAVIDQLSAQQGQLQLRPEFALVGVSAGAHLSMLYDYVYDADDRVKMVADVVGPSNLTDTFYTNNMLFPLALALLTDADAYPPGTNLAEALSPALQVGGHSSPTLMFYGQTDQLVPIANAYTLDSALQAHHVPHHLTVYPGGHGDWPDSDLDDVLQQIDGYIEQYLGVE